MYKSIVNEHIKERRVKIRSKLSPWMNGSIRIELNRKYKLLKTAQNTNSDSDWKQYKVARNYCTHLVRSAEAIYWKKRFSDVSTSREFWKTINLITDRQWGFKKGVSPEMHLINMTETWREHIEQGKLIGVIFLDFRKAFDSVSHQTLLMKLQAAGVSGNLYELRRNYLQNRLQYVSIGNVFSNKQNVLAGVPQGSLFGPRAYKIYSNNLPDSTSNDLEMFADDSTGYCVSDSLYELCMVLQNTILELEKWAKINSLNIHPVKTELMILSKKPVFGPFPLICVGNKPVNFVMKSKCLGIYIDRNLT